MPKSAAPAAVLLALMDQYNLNPTAVAKHIGLSQPTVRSLALGNVTINTSIALRLSKFFGTTPAYWLDLQTKIDLDEAKKDKELTALIKGISRVKKQPIEQQHNKVVRKAEICEQEPVELPTEIKGTVKDPAEPRVPKKRGRKPKERPVTEPAAPKKRGRKPKVRPPVQEYTFTPRVILIKKKDITASALQGSPDAAGTPDEAGTPGTSGET
jgi:addiction module HigA family antidote